MDNLILDLEDLKACLQDTLDSYLTAQRTEFQRGKSSAYKMVLDRLNEILLEVKQNV